MVVNIAKVKKERVNKASANKVAFTLLITPVATGLLAVLAINLSESLSKIILRVFAAPAAKVPPIKVAIVIFKFGRPLLARKSAGTVVTNKSSTTRNFMSAM
jgi:hypothetical protein